MCLGEGGQWGAGHEDIICTVVVGKYFPTRFPGKVVGNGSSGLGCDSLFPW